MNESPSIRTLTTALALWLVLAPLAVAQEKPAASGAAPDSLARPAGGMVPPTISLDEARELIKNGDYDRAIELLKTGIEESGKRVDRLREAYLLLIKTYVFLGNDYKFKPQGREMSNLNYQAARDLITKALKTKELRHLRPEAASGEYPPEMISAFADVRSEIFGGFRVSSLTPTGSIVMLDADTLGAFPGDTLPGDVDLAIGAHTVYVHHPGFKAMTEEIVISPGTTLERSYDLQKRRGKLWYATAATGVAGVIGGVIALAAGSGSKPPAVTPLPPAPPPPTIGN